MLLIKHRRHLTDVHALVHCVRENEQNVCCNISFEIKGPVLASDMLTNHNTMFSI